MQYSGEKLAVIADDLTGACDTACQFALYGFRPVVLQSLEKEVPVAHPFVVVNSDSRKDDAREARNKIQKISEALLRQRYQLLFKKMDSTLKGNWVGELAATIEMTRPQIVVVAPAFPVWGRTTIDGIQHVHGKPLAELRAPLSSSTAARAGESGNLVEALRSCFGNRVCLFKRSVLKKGPAAVARQMESARFQGLSLQVFDAVEDEDLKTIILGGCRLDSRILWTGAAGLARYLPRGWGYPLSAGHPTPALSPEPIMVVNGSFNPANGEQLHRLETGRFAPILWIEDTDSSDSPETRSKIDRLRQSLDEKLDAVISVRLHKPIQSAEHLQRLQDALHFSALECLQQRRLAGMVIVGGDTAMNFYRRIRPSALQIEGEVEPGIPYGKWMGGLLDGQWLVTKAGGFGQAETLARAAAFLKGEQ